jgi:cytochrome c553
LKNEKYRIMKKIIKITAALTSVLIFAAMAGMPVSAQSLQKTAGDKKPIPSEVMKIAQKSCTKCHIDGGMGGLKFTEWDSYTQEKQAAKAKAMCAKVSGKIMPPKNFVKKNPGAAPTDADIKTICDWSASLQPVKK